jgi:hypothetical protein
VDDAVDPSKPEALTPTITAKIVKDRYERGVRAVTRESQEFWINKAYISGRQWVQWDRTRNTVQDIARDNSRVQITVNKLWPSSRTIMAKLLSRPLQFEVPPSGSDDASVRGAHISEAVLRDAHKRQNWEDLREELSWALWEGGTSFLALDWDPESGTTLGKSELTGKTVGTGDACVTVMSIVEVAFEPGTRNFEKAQWWIRAQAFPPVEVQERFKMEETPPTDANSGASPQARYVGSSDTAYPVELTRVLTYYERPSSKNPNGLVATIVGDKIVDGPHPWPFPFKDRLNVICFRETKIPGRATGDTVVSAAVPVQTAYNASWCNIIEHMKLSGNSRLLLPQGAIDDEDAVSDLPGEVLNYVAGPDGGIPSYLSPPSMPDWWIREPEMLSAQMDDILGLHAVSRGEAPVNVDSGVGLSVLVEQDNSPIGHLVKETADGWGRFATLFLKLYEDKVRETRQAKIQTSGQVPETVSWTGASLSGQTTAEVPSDALQPRSRAALFAMAQSMWDRKVTQDPLLFAKMADLPGQDDILQAISMDHAKAKRENHDMAMGTVCVPADFDNHADHIMDHNDFRKSARYESLDTTLRDLVDQHVQAHETMAAEEEGKRQAQAAVSQGLAATPTAQQIPTPIVPDETGNVPPPEAPGPVQGPTPPMDQTEPNNPQQ